MPGGRTAMINQIRRFLIRLGSILGDVNAVSRGPKAIAKRVVRKATTRESMKLLGRIFK